MVTTLLAFVLTFMPMTIIVHKESTVECRVVVRANGPVLVELLRNGKSFAVQKAFSNSHGELELSVVAQVPSRAVVDCAVFSDRGGMLEKWFFGLPR